MDPTIKGAIIAAAAGVGCVVLGVMFEVVRVWWRDRKTRARVRTMLRLEIDQNLEYLRQCWEHSKEFTVLGRTHQLDPLEMARELTRFPAVTWSHRFMDAVIPQLPLALNESEIREVHQFHTELDVLAAIQAEAVKTHLRMESDKKAEVKDFLSHQIHVSVGVGAMTLADLGNKFGRMTKELLERGNPLRSTATAPTVDPNVYPRVAPNVALTQAPIALHEQKNLPDSEQNHPQNNGL